SPGCLRLRYSSGARPRLASSKRATTCKKKGTKKHEPKQPQSGWTRCTSGQFCRSDSGGKRSVAGAGKKHFDAGGPAALEKWALRHTRESDCLVLESSANAFAVAERLGRLKRKVLILDSHR